MTHDRKMNRSHFVCFHCRKMFVKILLRQAYGGTPERQEGLLCSECGGGLANIGRAFHPPRRHDAKNWKRVEQLYKAGYHWFAASDGDCFAPQVRNIGTIKSYLQVSKKVNDRTLLDRAKETKREQRLQKNQERLASRSRAGRSLTNMSAEPRLLSWEIHRKPR